MRGISHAIVTTRSTTSVTGAPQFRVFFVPFTHFSRCGLCVTHFENENRVSERANRMASIMRWVGSEPRVGQGTGVQHKPLMLTSTDVYRSRTGLLQATWRRKQLLLIAVLAGALLQTQHYVKPLNIFSHLMLRNPERQVFYPQFIQESFKAQR